MLYPTSHKYGVFAGILLILDFKKTLVSLHNITFRVLLFIVVLLNSTVASATLPCAMGVGTNDSNPATNVESHMGHAKAMSQSGALSISASISANMDVMMSNQSDTTMAECCDTECHCKISCGHLVLHVVQGKPSHYIGAAGVSHVHEASALSAFQKRIFHPPIVV